MNDNDLQMYFLEPKKDSETWDMFNMRVNEFISKYKEKGYDLTLYSNVEVEFNSAYVYLIKEKSKQPIQNATGFNIN
jgi:hypothetical protein